MRTESSREVLRFAEPGAWPEGYRGSLQACVKAFLRKLKNAQQGKGLNAPFSNNCKRQFQVCVKFRISAVRNLNDNPRSCPN